MFNITREEMLKKTELLGLYVYDHKHSNIPAGYGYKEFKTKKECLEEAVKLNKL